MTVTLGFDVEEFDFPLERGREIDLQTQLAVSSAGLEALLQMHLKNVMFALLETKEE